MNDLEREILRDFKTRILTRFPGARLILFGSRAHANADPDSDMDVLVILDCVVSSKEREAVSECAWQACFGLGIVLAPVAVSRREWEEGILSSSLLAIAVAQDGVAL